MRRGWCFDALNRGEVSEAPAAGIRENQAVRERAAAGAGADDDHVVVLHHRP